MIKHGMEREKQNESHTLVHKHGFRENASSFSLFPTIKREFICTFIHSSVWWLSVALFGGQEGLGDNINSPYQKRSERWTWSCEKRGTSDEWWCTKHIYILLYIYNSSIHLWVMPLHDVCLFAICEILEDILWYSGSSIIDLPVLNQHFCSPSSLPQTCDEKAAGLPRFPSHINIKVLCSPRKWGIHNVRRKWNAVVWCFDKWTPASTVQFRATFHFLHFPKNSCSTNKRKLTKITNSA